MHDAYEIKQEIEAEYETILGATQMENLRTALKTLLEHAMGEELGTHHPDEQ